MAAQFAADGTPLNLEAAQANLQKFGGQLSQAQSTKNPGAIAAAQAAFSQAQQHYSKFLNASNGSMDTHSLIDFLHPAPQPAAPKR